MPKLILARRLIIGFRGYPFKIVRTVDGPHEALRDEFTAVLKGYPRSPMIDRK
jgi:hypothetical protein